MVAENLKSFRLIVKYKDGTDIGSIVEMRGDFSLLLAQLTSCVNDEGYRAHIRTVQFYEDE